MEPYPTKAAATVPTASDSAVSGCVSQEGRRRRVRLFALFVLLLCAAFALPLADLGRFAFKSDLYSFILLVPFISAYLVWRQRQLFPSLLVSSTVLAVTALAIGAATLGLLLAFSTRGGALPPVDRLSLQTFAFLCLLVSGALLILGRQTLRSITFPVAFLVFMVPMPTFLTHWLEVCLQHASAEAAAVLFAVTGTTVSRQGLTFQLTGVAVEVAEQCSGIHSSLVLFITSMLGGHLLLRSKVSRVVLALAVVPLAIARNGFRIFVLAALASAVDPAIMQSPLHQRGGPLFFVMSLVPFLALLWILVKLERRKQTPL